MSRDPVRQALLIATDEYKEFENLRSPVSDANALARVLSNPEIAGFDVEKIVNRSSQAQREAIEGFFSDRIRDDVLLLHISCHGVRANGQLHFATTHTRKNRLRSTALPQGFLQEHIDTCRARCIFVLLDCCYSGMFISGAKSDSSAHALDGFGGQGVAVITSTDSVNLSWENDGEAEGLNEVSSHFTQVLIKGISTGAADLDNDGIIGINELFEYIEDEVRSLNPEQRPQSLVRVESGRLMIARVPASARRSSPPPAPPVSGSAGNTEGVSRSESPVERKSSRASRTNANAPGPGSKTSRPVSRPASPPAGLSRYPEPPESIKDHRFKPPPPVPRKTIADVSTPPLPGPKPPQAPAGRTPHLPSDREFLPATGPPSQKLDERRTSREAGIIYLLIGSLVTIIVPLFLGSFLAPLIYGDPAGLNQTPAIREWTRYRGLYYLTGAAATIAVGCFAIALPPWRRRTKRALIGALCVVPTIAVLVNIGPAQWSVLEAESSHALTVSAYPINEEIDERLMCTTRTGVISVNGVQWVVAMLRSEEDGPCTHMVLYQGWRQVGRVSLHSKYDPHFPNVELMTVGGSTVDQSFAVARVGAGITGVSLDKPTTPWTLELDAAAQYPKIYDGKLLIPRNDEPSYMAYLGTTGDLAWKVSCPANRPHWQGTNADELPPSLTCYGGGVDTYLVAGDGSLTPR